jgi:CBS domain-containing protein
MVDTSVREAMTESYIMLGPKTPSSKAAHMMAEKDADCVIVVRRGNPLGIVTASDFLRRIVAEGKNASEIPLQKIMSSPLITIDIQRDLSEALNTLSKHGIKRVVVLDGEQVAGIITSVEMLYFAEELGEEEEREMGPSMCEVCGGYFEVLEEVDGKFVCEDCKQMLEE